MPIHLSVLQRTTLTIITMNNVIYFNGGGVSNVQSGEHKMAILESIQNVSSGLTSSI